MNVLRNLATVVGVFVCLHVARSADLPKTIPGEVIAVPTFYVHAGVAGMFYSESARVRVLGVPVSAANVSIDDVVTPAFELGYFVSPNVAVSAAGGYPPISKVKGAGSLAGLGSLGKVAGGPVSASIHYHIREFGPFQPYIGLGVAAQVIFDEQDAALRNLRVRSGVGPMLQAGVDLMLDERWGVFLDVKKAWLGSKATAELLGARISSNVVLDPLVVHSGVTYRF